MARKLKIMENEKNPLNHLKNDKITAKRKKWEMHTVGPGIADGGVGIKSNVDTYFNKVNPRLFLFFPTKYNIPANEAIKWAINKGNSTTGIGGLGLGLSGNLSKTVGED